MLKKTSQISVLGDKICNKDMECLAKDVLNQNNKLKQMEQESFISGDICEDIFSSNTQFYLNPTEALRISHYVNEGDNFATVLSSGDFALDSVYAGAKNILTFDISKFQYPIALLKTQAIKVLSYDEYFSFFSDIYSQDYLSPDLYNQIVQKSKNPLLFAFWDIYFRERIAEKKRLLNDPNYRFLLDAKDLLEQGLFPRELLNMVESITGNDGTHAIKLFNDVYYNQLMKSTDKAFKPLKTINALSGESGERTKDSYIESSSSYEVTRERLGNVNISFIRTNIAKLRFNLVRTGYTKKDFTGFNSIYLSNIPEFLSGNAFANIVSNQLMPLLSENGSIIYCCQGIDEDVLKGSKTDDFNRARMENFSDLNITSMLNNVMEINDAEAYSILTKLYDVSLDVEDRYCEVNGNGKSDIYVRVMKR